MTKHTIDLEKAKLDPSSVFASPEDVVAHPELTREQMIEVLLRWEYDASELAVAEEEGMTDGEENILARVLTALNGLKADYDVDHTPPTKQGGLARKVSSKV